MSHEQYINRAAPESGPAASAPAAQDVAREEVLQRLVDQVAAFNLYVAPDAQSARAEVREQFGSGRAAGFRASQPLHRFDISLKRPSGSAGVRASNLVGEAAGRLDLRWAMIPYDFLARPDREPPPTPIDWSRSQRFMMQEMTFRLGQQGDGFLSFGTGRTFPMMVAGRAKLIAAAIGNITEGFGRFRGHEGNFTLCGEILPELGFVGHIVVRVVDQEGDIRVASPLPEPERGVAPDPGATYLMWGAQKGKDPAQENRFSLTPEGEVRGLNIPVHLKELSIGFTTQREGGFRSVEIKTGNHIGEEIGFGRGSIPDAPQTGTPLSPFQFEGVARYSLMDDRGKTLGAITTNVLEGRRFDVRLAGAPDETAWRFGFFGPIVLGTGCFSGAEGMFYGASGSVFRPPPGHHVITHLYMARINDPDGKFRMALNEARR